MTELLANSPTVGYPAAVTTLAIACGSSDTTITTGGAAPATLLGGQFRAIIGTEILLVTAGQAGTSWTVQRGMEGSIAAAHLSGAPIYHVWTAGGLAGAFDAAGAAAAVNATITKDVPNGIAGLDSSGLLKSVELPPSTSTVSYTLSTLDPTISPAIDHTGVTFSDAGFASLLAKATTIAAGLPDPDAAVLGDQTANGLDDPYECWVRLAWAS